MMLKFKYVKSDKNHCFSSNSRDNKRESFSRYFLSLSEGKKQQQQQSADVDKGETTVKKRKLFLLFAFFSSLFLSLSRSLSVPISCHFLLLLIVRLSRKQ